MDTHLRRLERRAAQGDLEAEGRLLLQRVRVGELDRGRLDILGHLGHPPALLALGLEGWVFPGLRDWVLGLRRWGTPVLVRALVAAARRVHADRPNPVRHEQLRSAEAWVECPCTEHARLAYEASRARAAGDPLAAYHVALAAHFAGNMSGPSGVTSLESVTKIALRAMRSACGRPQPLRAAIQTELSSWALTRPGSCE